MTPQKKIADKLYEQIESLLSEARKQVFNQVNQTMVYTYYEIGKIIVESEQGGKARAEYGKGILKNISKRLSKGFGKGFSTDNLENMRKFYLAYSKIRDSVSEIYKSKFSIELVALFEACKN